ncbi:MAG: hypothetical protein J6J17_00995 [Bacilli bacterium]|nr:hypothetical protein [Bacilli bacterium]
MNRKITDILDNSLSLNEKITIIENVVENNFDDFNDLSFDMISRIGKEINNVFKSVKKEIENSNKDIDKLETEIRSFNRLNYSSTEEFTEAINQNNSKRIQKKELVENMKNLQASLENYDTIRNSLEDKIIDIRKTTITSDIANQNDEIKQISEKINLSSDKIKTLEEKIKELENENEGYIESFDSMNFNINSNPLTDEEIDIAISFDRKINSNNDEISKMYDDIEEEKQNINECELKLKQVKALLSKSEKKEEKQAIAEETEKQYLDRFNELCSKEKLDKTEKIELKSLFQVLYGSKYLKTDQKSQIRSNYIKMQINSKEGKYSAEPNNNLNLDKKVYKVSKFKSIVAKGKLSTIKFIQNKFGKLASLIDRKKREFYEGKASDYANKAQAYLDKLKQINLNVSNVDDVFDVEEIPEIGVRRLGA